jgi:PKD repeat protein
MIRSLVARRSASIVVLLLIIGALAIAFFPHQPQKSNITVEIPAARENAPTTVERKRWPQWGGALNSADLAGDGFFDRNRARNFAASFEPQFRRFVIALNARTLLPQPVREHATDVLGPVQADEPARTAYLQFFEHPTVAEREQLARLGVELMSYCSGYAWLARGRRDAFERALRLPNTRALAAVDPRDKLSETVYRAFPYRSWNEGAEKPRGAVPAYAQDAEGNARFRLLALPGTTRDDVVQQLKDQEALPGGLQLIERPASTLGSNFEIVASLALAPEIAAIRSAVNLEFAAPPAASRGDAGSRDATTDSESNIDDVRDGSPNLSGSGVKVAVRELGKPEQHVDFKDRMTLVDTNGSAGSEVSHATAVCGQIASSGSNNPQAKGVAPAAQLLVYSVNPDTFDTADVLNAVSKGSRISNHSYGPSQLLASDFGSYQQISADWDTALRDNDLVGFFSGNEEQGGLSKHIDFFVGAKNTICVGATGPAAHAFDFSPFTPKSDGIAPYSEFGPMNDGRVKPDLVAFGGDNSNANVILDNGTNGTTQISGTSFAAPACTGIAALVFQHHIAVVGREPTAAMTKALLCNSATDLGALGPDQTYGFGIIDAEAAVNTINLRISSTSTPFLEGTLSNGEVATFTIDVQSSAQLKATLCWMDPAGNPNAQKALVNDLDLELIRPDGTTLFPFSLDAANPTAAATASGPNTVDPIEQIIVDLPATGTWTLRVKGTSIPSGPQPFAVCLNQSTTPPPVSFSIVASPESGPVPLPVGFTAISGTPGVQATFTWTFSDDNSTQIGQTVAHTFTQIGSFQVTLTVVTTTGTTLTYSKLIVVGKREVSAFAEKAKVKLDFSGTGKLSDIDLTMIANDPIKDLNDPAATKGFIFPRTKQQTRDSLRDGEFEGKVYTVRIAYINSAGVTQGAYVLPNVILDRTARFKTRTTEVRLNLLQGEVRIHVKDPNLPGQLGITAATTGPLNLSASLEDSSITYRANFSISYSTKKTTGTGKTP